MMMITVQVPTYTGFFNTNLSLLVSSVVLLETLLSDESFLPKNGKKSNYINLETISFYIPQISQKT